MRALVCVPSVSDVVGAGGVAPRWRGYVGELEAAGWAVELWCVDSADAQRRIPRCVHPFFPLTLTDLPSVPWMWALRRALRSRRPDVVVVTDLFNDVPVALLAAACAVPLAYSLHTDGEHQTHVTFFENAKTPSTEKGSKLPGGVPALASLSQAVTSRLAARVVTTSPSFARVLVERGVCPAGRVDWYGPISCDDLVSAAPSAKAVADARAKLLGGCAVGEDWRVAAYVGRWSAEKRINLLVRCRQASAQGWTLTIIGDAADDAVAADVLKWHDPPRVVVLRGMVARGPALAAVYAAADWLVSASDFETFGNTAQEAAACGTPGILQRGPGFVDQIAKEPSQRGTLVDFGAPDAAAKFDGAMDRTRHLLKKPDAVRRAASAGAGGRSVVDVVADAAKAGPTDAPRLAALCACFLLAAALRVFVTTFGCYLTVAARVSRLSPFFLRRLRPPARRVRWAGAINFGRSPADWRIWRSDLVSLQLGRFGSRPDLETLQREGTDEAD